MHPRASTPVQPAQPATKPCTTCSRPMVAVAWLGGRELARYCVACQARTPPASR
ncbi:hypothetical protein [Aquincola tertiaricarbonis]|uniref:hypothetical protein n=1 Tax=Aquincola tertiaricarbonis TaxID=391953 RepID=UPI0012ED91FB|nr:hypothetical protein [Aquincola tertiaricarbonis]